MSEIKKLPEKGFFAVIFSSEKGENLKGYSEMDDLTMKLAAGQPGFLGYESVNNGNKGIFISYWSSREAIEAWKSHSTHKMAKAQAHQWYKRYLSQICLVESSRLFENKD